MFPVICCKNITKNLQCFRFFKTLKIYGIGLYSLDLKKLIVRANIKCQERTNIKE